ncbi:MAG: bi-domain-containing oxidoreductase [Planctomycetota bacterium]|nr:bi-domain-containing oxidoreductase [Planctomycetota bacterium]
MKQVLQNLRTGVTAVDEVPCPGVGRGSVLIQTRASLISAGTEKMLVEFGKSSLIAKARSQPDKVKQVLDKIKTDGLLPTLEAVFNRLDEPLPLGYCASGVVLEVSPDVTEFRPGDRVASNGPHAEIVCVPKNLCAKIPDGVTDEEAAFTVLASIGLQGIRLANPTFGERVVVVGLGLIGLIAVRLLRAAGCEVLGVDLVPRRLELARACGAQTVNAAQGDPVAAAAAWTEGRGVDAVLITASAKNDDIAHQAALMCRKRGRIVLVGVVGLNLRRDDFYAKELSFQVSCSYGPGRYDEHYEQQGQDYPLGFVRWTEQRNFAAILAAIQSRQLAVGDLVTDRFALADAAAAYSKIADDPTAMGVMLTYPTQADRRRTIPIAEGSAPAAGKAVLGIIGAGNFSKMTLMPALRRARVAVKYIADLNGAAAQHLAGKFKVQRATSDHREVLADAEVNAVLVPLRHNLHARFVIEALEAGKHVFVEKPLAMNVEELRRILAAAAAHPDRIVMVGFNRRFSPHMVKIAQLLRGRSEPLCMNFLANPGFIPPDSWSQNPLIGGGRIIGEACHFIDLMVFLAGSKIATVAAAMVGQGVATREDKMSITLGFEDGSVGTVNYFSNGPKNYPKEQLQVFSDGRVADMNNFRRTDGFGFRGFSRLKTFRQDKGHEAQFAAFVDRVATGGPSPVPLDQLVNVTLASFAAMTSAAQNRTVIIAQEYADLLASQPS